MHFYKLFELKCVLAVCTQPPDNEVHPVVIAFSNEVTRMEAPSTIVDWQ